MKIAIIGIGATGSGLLVDTGNERQGKRVNFSFADPVAPNARPSMRLSHLGRRPSETEAINGAVPRMAKEVVTTALCNEALTTIVQATESTF